MTSAAEHPTAKIDQRLEEIRIAWELFEGWKERQEDMFTNYSFANDRIRKRIALKREEVERVFGVLAPHKAARS